MLGFSMLALFQGMLVAALAPARTAPDSRAAVAGRVGLGVVFLAALPGFAGAVADILSA